MEQKFGGIVPYPTGLLRELARLPLQFYRLGLGLLVSWLPFIVLTTRGRKTGLPHHTVLEYRRHGSKFYVFSGWGKRPDWYKNLLDDQVVTVCQGNWIDGARAVVVDDSAEALRALYMFRRGSPFLAGAMARMSTATVINLNTLSEVADQFTIVRLEINNGPPSMPSIPADQAWAARVFGLGMLAFVVIRLFRLRNNKSRKVQ